MNHVKTKAAAALGALLLVGALVVLSRDSLSPKASAAAAGYLPTDDRDVLELLPSGPADPRARELAAMRRALAASPGDVALATRLARRNIEEGRARSDPRYLGYAQAALAPWWQIADAPPEVLVLRATIRQSTHDFESALADLDRALAAAPNDPQAWLTRSVVLSVRGEHEKARASCEPLARLTSALVHAVCAESVRSLTGGAKEAYSTLSATLAATPHAAPAEEAWAASTLGEIAERAGDTAAAEVQLQRALALDPSDSYALAAYADVLLDLGRGREVLARLGGATQNDGLLLRLALAEAQAGDARAAGHVELLRARFDASRARGDVVHRREEARFALELTHEPARALELARANWDVQREPWDVRILLEAARATGDRAAARPALDFIAQTRLEGPKLRALREALE